MRSRSQANLCKDVSFWYNANVLVEHRDYAAWSSEAPDEAISTRYFYSRLDVDHGGSRPCGNSIPSIDAVRRVNLAHRNLGEDHKFVPAEATINGEKVVVQAAAISHPVAVRYGYQSFVNPLGNLSNKQGLPASPFRSDDWNEE